MDIRIQLTAALIVLVNVLYAQCNTKRIEIFREGSCEYIAMSKEKFAYYYQTEKNLEAIKDTLPKLIKQLEEKKKATVLLYENTEEVKTVQSKALTNCYDNLTMVELENIRVTNKLNFYKKTTIGSIALFLTTLLILK